MSVARERSSRIRSEGRLAVGPDAKVPSRDDQKLLSSNRMPERVGPEVPRVEATARWTSSREGPVTRARPAIETGATHTPSGSADGGRGTRVSGVGRPDKTLRAVTTIRMIRG